MVINQYAFSSGGGGGIALVANAQITPGASGGTTSAIDTTWATLLVISISAYSSLVAPTDSKGNTWIPLTPQGGMLRMYYCESPVVGSGHTFTSGSDYAVISVLAFSGAGAFHTQNGTNAGSQPGAVTPSVNGSLIVTGVQDQGGGAAPTINSGFTAFGAAYTGGVNIMGGVAYLIQETAASVNPTWASAGSSANRAVIADFAPV